MEECLNLFENLSEVQMEAVKTIDEDLEIIACAGAGKAGVVTRIIDESFYLPYATKKLAENMYKSVTKAINHYVEHNRQEFANIQMAETDIEIDMGDGIKVNGR